MAKKTIGERDPEFQDDEDRRHASRTCLEGHVAFQRDAAAKDLPGVYFDPAQQVRNRYVWPTQGTLEVIVPGSNFTVYDRQVQSMIVDDVWAQSVQALAAAPFGSSPTLSGWDSSIYDPDAPTVGFWTSVDDQRRPFVEFWSSIFLWKIVDGVRLNLVTKSREPEGAAYFAEVSASQILRRKLGDDGKLAEVDISMPTAREVGGNEDRPDDPNDLPMAKEVQRVLRYRTSAQNGGPVDGPPVFRYAIRGETEWYWEDDWEELLVRAGPEVTEIPLYAHYGNRVASLRGWPVFDNAARLQASLVRKQMNLDRLAFKTSRPLVAFPGASPPSVKSTSEKRAAHVGDAIYLPENCKPLMLEPSGASLESLQRGVDKTAESVRISCLRPALARPYTGPTATEVRTEDVSSRTRLEAWVVADFAPFREAFAMKARLDGVGQDIGDVYLPHEFDINGGAIEALWRGYVDSGGRMPPEVMVRELRRAGWIDEQTSIEDFVAQLKEGMEEEDEEREASGEG